MRRRLDLAASLVGRPRVLYLDEPTTGLDPHSRNEVWGMIRQLVTDGTTVLLTTQYLEEADQLAHDIAVIDHGAVIATGTPDELKASAGRQVLEVTPASRADLSAVAELLAALTGATPTVAAESGQVSVQVEGGRSAARSRPRVRRPVDRARRVRAAPGEPRRGVPRPHRPPCSKSEHRGRRNPGQKSPSRRGNGDQAARELDRSAR